jgi:2-C-methyl-D-erythritol 4-phosphate cytidylyltransferase/2-C-methyl-D-erythritol 2,4-cyclodiphosphate synthase
MCVIALWASGKKFLLKISAHINNCLNFNLYFLDCLALNLQVRQAYVDDAMDRFMQIAALIVAAGRGSRAGAGTPKQWQTLAGMRVMDHTLRIFTDHPRIDRILVVLHADDTHLLDISYERAIGGDQRQISVLNGLNALSSDPPDFVLIHDVARATTPPFVIDNVIDALQTHQGAAPALAVTDALWAGHNGLVQKSVSRSGLFRAQTPQGFHFAPILAAHRRANSSAKDDVEVALQAGLHVAIVGGSEDNIKITYPEDFDRAANILKDR